MTAHSLCFRDDVGGVDAVGNRFGRRPRPPWSTRASTRPRSRPQVPPVTTLVLSLRFIGLVPCLVSAEPY
jgi:hypothetical protein